MRQVPHYLIIGNGRVARHFQHYFTLLDLPFDTWHRPEPLPTLHEKLTHASHVLLLISDNSIENFITPHLTQSTVIHFSGSLVSTQAYGDPLMTFNNSLYNLDHYKAIPFVVDHDAPEFKTLLPGLSNPHIRLDTALKPKYHALCVLSGNFSCLLWQKLFFSLEQEFNIPASIAYPYLQQQTKNLLTDYPSALTGPLARQDTQTLSHNLNALEGDIFQDLYQSFVTTYQARNI